MIKNQDRSKWFGASDTSFITGNYDTNTFCLWWLEKLGYRKNNFQNKFTLAGTNYEHKIAKFIENRFNVKLKLDRQKKIRRYRLRVNFDATSKMFNEEIKTSNKVFEKIPKNYWEQTQVQMFADKKTQTRLSVYLMEDDNYLDYFLELKKENFKFFIIQYDIDYIKTKYLPRLKYLNKCLSKKELPTNKGFSDYYGKSNNAH